MTPNPQDSAVALEVERAAFEAWAKKRGNRLDKFGSALGIWAYEDDETQAAFVAWQARASQSDGTSGGWISVDERLPAHEQEVICSGFEGNDPTKKRWQEFAVFHRDGLFYNRETGDDYYPPTHWREMPALPAAPNQGENHVG